jgi:alpha-galactosidase
MVANGMKDAGYLYINIDDCWEAKKRDAQGLIQVDAGRFPGGMKALADYVHSKGLKLGVYTDAGAATCQGRPGSKGYESGDARSYAGWGVDYVKEDWCNTQWGQDPKASYATMAAALLKTGRPIVLSLCDWGRQGPWEWGADAGGNLWRTTLDITPYFSSVLAILDQQAKLARYARPGHWNDPDMLEVGNGMTPDEDRAHFSLWAILAAPLIAGNDLTNMPEETRAVLTAPEVLAVDQDPAGIEGTRIRKNGALEVWARPLRQENAWAVVLLNRGASAGAISVDWNALGLKNGDAAVRDLWTRRDLGAYKDRFETVVRPHSAVMVKIVKEPS